MLHHVCVVPDVLPLAGKRSERFTKGDVRRSRDRHQQTADGLPQTGHQVRRSGTSGRCIWSGLWSVMCSGRCFISAVRVPSCLTICAACPGAEREAFRDVCISSLFTPLVPRMPHFLLRDKRNRKRGIRGQVETTALRPGLDIVSAHQVFVQTCE